MQIRETGLVKQWQAFIEITKNIENTTDVQKIIEVVIDTIDKVDGGFLLLWDTTQETLIIEAAVNFNEEYYIHSRLAPGEGISGTVFKTGKTLAIHGENEVKKAMSNMKEPNYQYYLKSSVQQIPPKSCLSVPITYKDTKIGVLTLDNFFSNEDFTEEEIGFVEAIATQIAMVLILGQNLEEKEKRAQTLSATLASHHNLNEIILNARDTKQIILSLASMIDKEILYFDANGHYLFGSHKSTNMNLSLIIDWVESSLYQFPSKKQYFQVYLPNDITGYIFKISSLYGITGYLLVICPTNSLDIYSKLTLSHGTAIMAIEQMKEQKFLESKVHERMALFQRLLISQSDETINTILDDAYFQAYCLLAYKQEGFFEANYANLLNLEPQYQSKLQAIGTCIFFPHKDSLIILIALRVQNENIENSLNKYVTLQKNERILIGRIIANIGGILASYQDLELLQNTQHLLDGTFISYKKLGIYRYLLSMSSIEKQYFIEEILNPILPSQDNKLTKNDLLETLINYFHCHKNVAQTAERMHMHQNTVYYRIQQIEEKLQLDLNDSQHSMNIQAALFLFKQQP
ncbi:helix-turn-helix domain-containing protein [Viridibacillus arvi]|uniref:helix-turn-helix domain-containing protein n=1 Tax=Viridibacillus arvi TaxID=263475 RepID=UPI003CFD1E8A